MAASSRLVQCVTPSRAGGGVNVAVITRRWSSCRAGPGRGSSANPASPSSANRSRHLFTVGRDTCTRSAITWFGVPAAASNTIRARNANPAEPVVDRVNDTSFSRSPSRNASSATRIHDYPKSLPSNYFRHAALDE